MRALGKRVNSQGFRGFESLPLRHVFRLARGLPRRARAYGRSAPAQSRASEKCAKREAAGLEFRDPVITRIRIGDFRRLLG